MLDSARFQYSIAEKLNINPVSVDAYILGEHGDTSFPVFSSANIAGKPLFDFPEFTKVIADQCVAETQTAAYRIIHDLGFTCYSIATVINQIMKHLFMDSRVVLPLSTVLEDYYGHNGLALSVPCILGGDGIVSQIKVPLNKEEQEALAKSAHTIKSLINS